MMLTPCSFTAPCKTFAGALLKTSMNGEISVMDSGAYSTVNINKSITINSNGNLASILASGITGIIVNITDPADTRRTVTIRGLSIQGSGGAGAFGINGIQILSAAKVHIEDTVIENFTQNGVNVLTSGATNIFIDNSRIENCNGAGISADTSAGIARVTMRNSSIASCGTGINARRNSRVAMDNGTVSFNGTGVFVEGNGGTAVAVLTNSQIANNTGIGIRAGGGAATNTSVARLSNNIINNNSGSAVSIQVNGSIETFGNNQIVGNNPDGCVGCVSISGNIN